jgi:hypothetical protein
MGIKDMTLSEITEALFHYKERASNLECCGNCKEGRMQINCEFFDVGDAYCPQWSFDGKTKEQRSDHYA